MDDQLHALEQEYCPPLDPALIHALYPDYAGQPDGTQVLRHLLEGLKQTAAVEQLTDFDPSGSSSGVPPSNLNKQSDDVDSATETWTSRSQTDMTGSTSPSNGLPMGTSDLDADSPVAGSYFRETERYDTPTKEALLADTFPNLRRELVTYTLKKCGDDFEKATDELLNHVYFHSVSANLEEEGSVVKGIDAFSEEHHLPQRRKKGKKKKNKAVDLYGVASASNSEPDFPSDAPASNRWKDTGRDVEFLASRTNVSTKTVSSLYHANGLSLAGTIIAMMNQSILEHGKKEPEAQIIQPALDLNDEFPNIELEYAIALIRLTTPSSAHAHELATRLTAHPSTMSVDKGSLQFIPKYRPVKLSEPAPQKSPLPELAPSMAPRTAASLSAARSSAFDNASAAYRKGRSNPLYKAAAGYYAQVGRDANAHLRAQSEIDADAFVSQQSTSTVLDLHGVTVESATRIALQRTKAWWINLGEARIPGYGQGRGGARDGFRIVTGLGRHSEGGRGKIGPAVVRALVKEGWRVEVGSGELIVTGKAKRA